MASRLSLWAKLSYGIGEVAVSVKNATLSQFLLFFYVDVIHLAPVLVGIAIFIGRCWDAITDPIVGYISDTTRSRWGRRRPYVLGSVLPVAIAFYLLFTPPRWPEVQVFVYLVLAYVGLMTVFTFYATPYLAWGAELTDDYHLRTSVVQLRALFGVVGTLVGAALPVAISNRFDDARTGFSLAAAILAAIILGSGLAVGLGVREQRAVTPPPPSWRHFLHGLKHTLGNRDFQRIFAVFCAMTLAASVGNSVQLFVIKYWLGLYEFFPAIAVTFGGAFVVSFPLWRRLSQKVGKHRALLYGLGLGCIVPWGWFLVPPGGKVPMLLLAAAGGVSMGSVTLAMSSAIDIIDIDEWHTGERREGAYFGIWTLGLKTMGALGALLGGGFLSLLGAGSSGAEGLGSDEGWRLIWLVGPLQVLSHASGLLLIRRLRWGPKEVAEIQMALAARRKRSSEFGTMESEFQMASR
ncbi:MAG: sugar transporter [Candidatus Binatia bacterium]|nr:MAG: sugar transporter [Candidatus Binatia bacterium]